MTRKILEINQKLETMTDFSWILTRDSGLCTRAIFSRPIDMALSADKMTKRKVDDGFNSHS